MNAGIQKRVSSCITERSLPVDQASAHTKSVAMAPCRDKIERDSLEREDTNTQRFYRLEREIQITKQETGGEGGAQETLRHPKSWITELEKLFRLQQKFVKKQAGATTSTIGAYKNTQRLSETERLVNFCQGKIYYTKI